MSSPYVTIAALPKPGETTSSIHTAPDDDITIIQVGPLTLQFSNSNNALAWVAECGELVEGAIARKATQ